MKIEEFNSLPAAEAETQLMRCCGSRIWATKMAKLRPFESVSAAFDSADRIWNSLSESDWLEAFKHHPKIGAKIGAKIGGKIGPTLEASTSAWASEEQKGAVNASAAVLADLAADNEAYEKLFGYIFLVCATGKTAEQMLQLLRTRLKNPPEVEIGIAAGEQAEITRIRLEKLFT